MNKNKKYPLYSADIAGDVKTAEKHIRWLISFDGVIEQPMQKK